MNNTNNMSARDSYIRAREVYYKAFIENFKLPNGMYDENKCWAWVNSLKMSQSEIRCEVELNVTQNNFAFGVTTTQNNSSNVLFATEQRLNQQDSLVVSEYGIFIANTAGNNDTAFDLNTYADPVNFPLGFGALNSTFYSNGAFQLNCNNDVVIPYRGLFNHWYRPQTQQTAALGAGSPENQIRGAEDGMITMEPNLLLIGSKNYVPQINLRAALAAIDANTRAILIFRGILAQNSTVVS